jgi:hypothetical protein
MREALLEFYVGFVRQRYLATGKAVTGEVLAAGVREWRPGFDPADFGLPQSGWVARLTQWCEDRGFLRRRRDVTHMEVLPNPEPMEVDSRALLNPAEDTT